MFSDIDYGRDILHVIHPYVQLVFSRVRKEFCTDGFRNLKIISIESSNQSNGVIVAELAHVMQSLGDKLSCDETKV